MTFARAGVMLGTGFIVAASLLPVSHGESHGAAANTSSPELEHPLEQCRGDNAGSYCCVTGGGGGWGALPLFPQEYTWSPGVRAFLYLFGLLWTFLGVAILSDAFMAGIETITGQTKMVTIKDEDGNDVTTEELVWNPAVANLTLLALGSSAPEIMMSCIELLGSQAYFGPIGAPTIVGSGKEKEEEERSLINRSRNANQARGKVQPL